MQTTKEITEQENLSSEAESKSDTSLDERSQRSLKQRYIDLWRARRMKDDFESSLVPPMVMGLISFVFGLSLSGGILSGSILLTTGALIGLLVSGYKYNLDNFTGFHVGVISYIPMAVLLTLIVTVSAPIIIPANIVVVLFYAASLGASGLTFTELGREMGED